MNARGPGQDGCVMNAHVALAGEPSVPEINKKALVPEVRSTKERPADISNPEVVLRDMLIGK